MSNFLFWTTLIEVHSSAKGNAVLDENCIHVTGPYWIMEGETEFLVEEGVKFDEVAWGAVGALGDLSTEELIAICKQSYGVDLDDLMTHPLERRHEPPHATCAYHKGIETVVSGSNNEAFVKCKDGYGKEIE